jgi:hypothetical protein
MGQAYGEHRSVSTINRWRIILIGLAALVIGGVILMLLLAGGLADPPRVGSLRWQVDAPGNWPITAINAEIRYQQAPVPLPDSFTLELSAQNSGLDDSAWGIWLDQAHQSFIILVDNQGYYAITADQPDWAQFRHIRRDAINSLYLHVQSDGTATLRINNEIAWEGPLDAAAWGIALYRQPQLSWGGMALYSST